MVAFTSQWQCPRVGEYIHKMQEERNEWAQEHKQDQPRPPPDTWVLSSGGGWGTDSVQCTIVTGGEGSVMSPHEGGV